MLEKLNGNEQLRKRIPLLTEILMILFMLLVTLGSYIKIKFVVIIIYLTISVFLALPILKRCVSDFFRSPMMICWLIYSLAGLLSTLFIEHEYDLYIFETQLSFTFILFILTRYMNMERFLKMFRVMMTVLVGIALFQEITGIYVFRFLKEGTPFPYVDVFAHGITSFFEYRHYFGCYLLLAFFSLFFYPEERPLLNYSYGIVFILAIVLTYTRCIWIAFGVGLLGMGIYEIRVLIRRHRKGEKRGKFSLRTVIAVGAGVLLTALLIFIFREQVSMIIERIMKRLAAGLDPTNASVANRLFNVQKGTAYLLENWQKNLWIGMGNGSALKWLSTAEGAKFRDAIDCQYVQTFMETGIVGLGALIAMIVYCFNYFFKSRDKKVILFSLTFLMIALSFFFFEVIVVSSSVFVLWDFVLVVLCTGKEGRKELLERSLGE